MGIAWLHCATDSLTWGGRRAAGFHQYLQKLPDHHSVLWPTTSIGIGPHRLCGPLCYLRASKSCGAWVMSVGRNWLCAIRDVPHKQRKETKKRGAEQGGDARARPRYMPPRKWDVEGHVFSHQRISRMCIHCQSVRVCTLFPPVDAHV